MACILVVDDDEGTTGLMIIALRKAGYTLVKAGDGAQAMEAVRQYQPDLILLDIMMPDIDGIEVCRKIRANQDTFQIPIIMVTVLNSEEHRRAAMEAGADDYVTKPVRFEELKNRIHALLETGREGYRQNGNSPGKVIAVMGVHGGTGATTASVNLAVSILTKYPRALVAELSPGNGRLAQQLGLQPSKSLLDLVRQNAILMNPATIHSAIVQHACGLNVLAGGFDPSAGSETDSLRLNSMETLIAELATNFNPVFLDLGHIYSQQVKVAIKSAKEVVLVIKADPLSLRAAVQQIKLIEAEGTSWWRIHLLLVCFNSYPYSLSPQAVRLFFDQMGVRCNILASIPPLAQQIYLAEQQGAPLVEHGPSGAELKCDLEEAVEMLLSQ